MLSSLALSTAVLAHGPVGAGFGWLFFLVPLFWIGLLVLLFALLGRRFRRGGWGGGAPWAHAAWQGHAAARGAEATLAERFATGDIDEKEYRARLEVIRANAPVPPAR